jgi:hypothetical protein
MNKNIDFKSILQKSLDDYEKNKDKIQAKRLEEARNNPNCLSFWYPKIKDILNIKTPKTLIIPFDYNDLLHSLDNNTTDSFTKSLKNVEAACDSIGYPCFIKNSLYSAKHSWKYTCFIESKDNISNHLKNITDSCYCVGAGDSLFIVVREIIKTKAAFYAFDEMPITKERRYFIKDGKVTFHHPYWPPHSIQNPSCSDWKEKLDELNWESDEEIALLTNLSETVSKHIDGSWSVDWLQDAQGNWYLIDMAIETSSFKWVDYARGIK